jgi:hypothetical protein
VYPRRPHPALRTRPHLHFVGDAEATRGAHVGIRCPEVPRRQDDGPADALHGFCNEACDAATRRKAEYVGDVGGVAHPSARSGGTTGDVGAKRAPASTQERWEGRSAAWRVASALSMPACPLAHAHLYVSGHAAWWMPGVCGTGYFHVESAVRPIVPRDIPW